MEDLIPLLIVEVPLVASLWFFHKRSGRPTRPLRAATSVMVATAILLLAGSTGYNLNALDATAAGTPWTGAVLCCGGKSALASRCCQSLRITGARESSLSACACSDGCRRMSGANEPQTSTQAGQQEDPQWRTILPGDIEWMPYRITVFC